MVLNSRSRRLLLGAAFGCLPLFASLPAHAAAAPSKPGHHDHARTHAAASTAAAAGTVQLQSGGGPVLANPSVYLSFWGTPNASARSYLESFFSSAGASGWANVATQYCSSAPVGATTCAAGAAFAGNPANQWKGSWVDTTAVPTTPIDTDIESAALRAVGHFGYHPDAIYFVMTPSGHNESGFGSSWCAWHGSTVSGSSQIPYAYLPYQPDAGAACGVNAVNPTDGFGHGIFDGLSIVGGHEYMEAITDPYPNSGWIDVNGDENGDKCQWSKGPVANYTFGGQFFAVQPTWSNTSASCAMSLSAAPPPPPPPAAAWTGYLSWYDNVSPGMYNDNIHIVNPNGSPTTGAITLGATSVPFSVPAGGQSYFKLPAGSIGGPLVISASARVIASQRVQFNSSFNEVGARTAADASPDVWFPWYDHASYGMVADNIHVVNPGSSAVSGSITIGNPPIAQVNFTVPANGTVHPSLPTGVIGGPVHIHASGPLLATQRVQYLDTFNEIAGHASSDAASTLYFNWYDHASGGMLNDNVHVINPGGTTVTGTVKVGAGGTIAATSFTLPAYSGTYVNFNNQTIGGPITVTASGPVLASQRVQFFNSFNETLGRPASDAATTLYMPWYDLVSWGMVADNIHLLNPSGTAASGTITVAGNSISFQVPANGEWYSRLPGTIGGPVLIQVTSGPAVMGSQRVQFLQSFNEAAATS